MKFIVATICCLLVFTCVRVDTIYNGTQAKDGQFPYQVVLLIEMVKSQVSHESPETISIAMERSRENVCGGSILTPTTIITAAHCVCETGVSEENLLVRVGSNNCYQGGQLPEVEKIICHEKYENPEGGNDIALVILKTKLNYSENVNNITLPNEDVVDKNLSFAGWGYIDCFKNTSAYLWSMEFKILNKQDCVDATYPEIPLGRFCAMSRRNDSGTLQGDSGGALVDKGHIQYGILSYGPDCGIRDSDIFTNVFYHKSWIEQNMV